MSQELTQEITQEQTTSEAPTEGAATEAAPATIPDQADSLAYLPRVASGEVAESILWTFFRIVMK